MTNLHPRLRSLLWRLGRKLYCFARGDLQNDPNSNGEYWFLESVLSRTSDELVLFDVGANKGDWTLAALSATPTRRSVRVFSFEPSSGTRAMLSARIGANSAVEVLGRALSAQSGEAVFYSSSAGAGTNSLNESSGEHRELVPLTTLDEFLVEKGLAGVSMVKIDTEGYDLNVLKGASAALAAGRIEAVQFEYNWRWLFNHASLRDVFELIKDKPYRLGKLAGPSIEFYDAWHFELDRYFENNYVLIRSDSSLVSLGKVVHFDASNTASAAR